MIELENDNLAEILADKERAFVQFGASWCGSCRMLKPKVKKFSEQNEGISFIYVDAEKMPESRKLAKVDNLPTFAVFKNGELVNQGQGNKLDTLKGLIDEIASH